MSGATFVMFICVLLSSDFAGPDTLTFQIALAILFMMLLCSSGKIPWYQPNPGSHTGMVLYFTEGGSEGSLVTRTDEMGCHLLNKSGLLW